jgi:hypothetical protein
MERLRRIAIVSTGISALALFFISNTGLALPLVPPNGTRPPCFPVFELTAFHSRCGSGPPALLACL